MVLFTLQAPICKFCNKKNCQILCSYSVRPRRLPSQKGPTWRAACVTAPSPPQAKYCDITFIVHLCFSGTVIKMAVFSKRPGQLNFRETEAKWEQCTSPSFLKKHAHKVLTDPWFCQELAHRTSVWSPFENKIFKQRKINLNYVQAWLIDSLKWLILANLNKLSDILF